MAASGYSRSTRPSEVIGALKIATRLGTYISSGEAARDTADVRESRIRQGLTEALHTAHLTDQRGAFEPLLDYLAARLAAESAGTAGVAPTPPHKR